MPDPIQLISTLLDNLGARADIEESAEWYLRSNLIDYKRALIRKTSSHELEFATAALKRFCADNLDGDSPLYRDCVAIADEGAKVAARLGAGMNGTRRSE